MKSRFWLLAILVAGASVGLAVISFQQPERSSPAAALVSEALAQSGDCLGAGTPLSGWAWSSNIGWVNFGNYTSGPAYGVRIDRGTGDFCGYAWSNNVGWIKFDPAASAVPEEPSHGARIAVVDGVIADGAVVEGWARACGIFQTPCDGGLLSDIFRGGWDGWIKMSGTTASGSAYGVAKQSGGAAALLMGFAWGDLNVGWLSFEPFLEIDGRPRPDFCRDNPTDPRCGVIIGGPPGGVPPLTAECNVSSPTEQEQEWTVEASGGTGPFTYCWGNLCIPVLEGDVGDVHEAGPVAGTDFRAEEQTRTYTGRARVTDDSDGRRAECTVSLTIPGTSEPEGDLEVDPTAAVVRISIHPAGRALSTTGRVTNIGDAPANACIEDVVSRPSGESLTDLILRVYEGSQPGIPPTCWLEASDQPVPSATSGEITETCKEETGQQNCTLIEPGDSANFAILLYEPLGRIRLNHPYNVNIVNQSSRTGDRVFLLFEYLVGSWGRL